MYGKFEEVPFPMQHEESEHFDVENDQSGKFNDEDSLNHVLSEVPSEIESELLISRHIIEEDIIQILIEEYGHSGKVPESMWQKVSSWASEKQLNLNKDKQKYGYALTIAASQNKMEIVRILLDAGAQTCWTTNEVTAFCHAVQHNNMTMLKLLIENEKLFAGEALSILQEAIKLEFWDIAEYVGHMARNGGVLSGHRDGFSELYQKVKNNITCPLTLKKNLAAIIGIEDQDYELADYKKIYKALYVAQQSPFKKLSVIQENKMAMTEHAESSKNKSRSKEALRLARLYSGHLNDKKMHRQLVLHIHEYGRKHSLFSKSRNVTALHDPKSFDTTCNTAGSDSRTGRILEIIPRPN